jgi:hypothetical protein
MAVRQVMAIRGGGGWLVAAVFATAFVAAWQAAPSLMPPALPAPAPVQAALQTSAQAEPAPPVVRIAPPPGARDMHFRRCREAHAAGRYSIPAWDPSYRAWMDGDHDGLACEPLPRYPARPHRSLGPVRVLH